MKLIADSIRIEGSRPEAESHVFCDTIDLLSGYGAALTFYPEWFHVVLCRQKSNPSRWAILSMPSNRWEDSIHNDWEIMQVINPNELTKLTQFTKR